MKTFKFPDTFLFGSATAATQIEGGDKNNNWYEWCKKGKIKDCSTTLRADDHWNRYREDVELLSRLNQKVYRMGLEWSRIEPEKGRFDHSAILHYRDEITLLRKKGIKPLVTLHHFTHPLWLSREGDFENPKVVEYFKKYVTYVVENIGDLVEEYITVNEPNVYIANGFFDGSWPPGKKSLRLAFKVLGNMAACHIEGYKLIHQIRKEKGYPGKTMVGVANHMRNFAPHSRHNPFDVLLTRLVEYLFQDSMIQLMTRGHLGFPASLFVRRCPKGEYCDFIGINYYTRSTVHFIGMKDEVPAGSPKNDLGWEIYPKGLVELCEESYRKYRLPVWITENGICDNNDSKRVRFIYDQLAELSQAIENGIPIQRYYHWSLMDNFEWLEGEAARFGLIHVDYDTQKRTIKRSGQFYGELIKNRGVSRELLQKYGLLKTAHRKPAKSHS
ncbi:MAG TPA: glycoside hydrolase family 1 protein [Clostridia bacterium]|nr:glycoside hydrolase family 1 protein [Clostridia bacterium]